MRSKFWIIGYLAVVLSVLTGIAIWVFEVDPFFHYHKPNTSRYFYQLDNQRSQNDGILKHFDYDGIITGTSLVENFKTSEANKMFGCSFVKTPFSGGTYKEINDNLKKALACNPKIRIVIRGLDIAKFLEDKDLMRKDLGNYPDYLYNSNPFDDVNYLFNRDVLSRVASMEFERSEDGFQPGITSFDTYSNWMSNASFGIGEEHTSTAESKRNIAQDELTYDEKNIIIENIEQNVTNLAFEYPDVEFIYFFPPYSEQWWEATKDEGKLRKQIEAERVVIEEILKTDNIKLFSYNDDADIIANNDNYKDLMHYGDWINSQLLENMRVGVGLLTRQNYMTYLEGEERYFDNLVTQH